MTDTDETQTEQQTQGEPIERDPHALDPDWSLPPDLVRAVQDALNQAAKHNKDPALLLAEQLVAVSQLRPQQRGDGE